MIRMLLARQLVVTLTIVSLTSKRLSERGPASASTETIVEAHMSGEIFLQEGPGKSPFVKIGGQVSVGHQLCIILCMKMSNQVSSPVDGTVAECLVTDEQVVDKGAPLFRITHG